MSCAKLGSVMTGSGPRQIRIVDYDAQWPNLYKLHADKIESALGKRALCVEHVGSTSVLDLPAKPVIDVLLVVNDSADEEAYSPELSAAGYELRIREPEWHEHRMFQEGGSVNLHVFSQGCVEIDRMLIFRDWLRSRPKERILYANAKRELAAKTWGSVQAYAEAKTPMVEKILARAQNDRVWIAVWRANNGAL